MSRLFLGYQKNVTILKYIIIFIWLIILLKIFDIQIINSANLIRKSSITSISTLGSRGNILDRNNAILATTIPKYDFSATTILNLDSTKSPEEAMKEIYDVTKISQLFADNFEKNEIDYKSRIVPNKKYIPLELDVPHNKCELILSRVEHLKGLWVKKRNARFYPYDHIGAHILGYVDINQTPQIGIEKSFNGLLSGKQHNTKKETISINENIINNLNSNDGKNVYLTIDINIQEILEEALYKRFKNTNAKSANAIIVDPMTGEIIAASSIPSYNPNKYNNYDLESYRNKVFSDAYEPGSIYKIIPVSAALEKNIISLSDSIFCENGKYQLTKDYPIHDHEPHGNLSLSQIFYHSSNIGISKIAQHLGDKAIYRFSRNFGFGIKTGLNVPHESPGILSSYIDWEYDSSTQVSIGQEITATTIQLAMAYSAIANGGFLLKPKLVLDKKKPIVIRQVVSNKTCMEIKKMMKLTIEKGTAIKAKIPGVDYCAKTGTAQKFVNGSVSNDNLISIFAAIFPYDSPQYVCIVSIDSPDYGKHWGGENAGLVVKEVFESLIHYNPKIIKKMNNLDHVITQLD